MKKEISLEDYACVLARMYAILHGKNTGSLFGGPNPFRADLDRELQEIHRFMENYKCREGDVVDRVRELIPETDWDKGLRSLSKEVKKSLDNPNADWESLNKKIDMYNKPDWKTRENLEDLYELE